VGSRRESAPWRIELLGGLRVVATDGVPTRFRTRQTAALLAYLALFVDRPHSRDDLADRFWPDADPRAARHRLSVALSSLRPLLALPNLPADALLLATRDTVQLDPAWLSTDVADFHAARRRADRASAPRDRRAALIDAVDLYQGELLPGHDALWVLEQRGWLAESFFRALRDLCVILEAAGELASAIEQARRGVSLDPLREDAQRDLIRLLALSGDREAALRQYRALEHRLKEEMGSRPTAETAEVARRIDAAGSAGVSPASFARTLPPAPLRSDTAGETPALPGRIPLPLTTLIGREAELRKTALNASRRLLYAAQMSLAQQAWDAGNVGRTIELLNNQRPKPGQEDLRSFEWRYLWRLCHGDVLFTLRGHRAAVTSIAFSPDGAMLATGSDDGTVKLWDLASWLLVDTLTGQAGLVHAVRFSPDGKTLASGASDRSIWLWDLASRRRAAILAAHPLEKNGLGIWRMEFSPDGRLMAAALPEGIAVWDLASRREIAGLISAQGSQGVAFSPKGRILAFPDNRAVTLWDLAGKRPVAVLAGHPNRIQSLAFSPDGGILALGLEDGIIWLWEVATKRELACLKGHGDTVFALAFSPDGKSLATCGSDLTLRLWDTATKQQRAVLRGHAAQVFDLAYSPDGKLLASASSDRTAKLWKAAPGREEETLLLRGHTEGGLKAWFSPDVLKVAVSPDAQFLASSGPEKSVRLWNLATRRGIGRLQGQTGELHSMAFCPEGKVLACGGGDGRITLWDVASRRARGVLRGRRGWVTAVVFSPDGRLLASNPGAEVKVWEVATRRELATLPIRDLQFMAFSPDGRRLAAVSSLERAVRRWEVGTWRPLSPLRVQTGWTSTPVAFSPTGRLLACGSNDGSVEVWDADTGNAVASVQGHRGYVSALAFSPDGETMASVGEDQTVKLWNVGTWQEVATLRGHPAYITLVAFSPDSNTLVSASIDGTVRLWRAATFAETDTPNGARFPQASR
jgi:WD40 repeat protein/DNA-binding SARP family transcriptional activator